MKKRVFKIGVLFVVTMLFFILLILVDFEIYGKEVLSNERIVTKIIDGDTIIVEGGEKVRILGVDCDERGKPCYSVAKNFAEEFLLGKTVILEKDIEEKDKYGRNLRYVFVDGDNFSVVLTERGYCVARFERDGKYSNDIVRAEKKAIENRIGCKWN